MTRNEEYKKIQDSEFRQACEFRDKLVHLSISELRALTLRKFHDVNFIGSKLDKIENDFDSIQETLEMFNSIMCRMITCWNAENFACFYTFYLEREYIKPRRDKKLLKHLRDKNKGVKTVEDWICKEYNDSLNVD